MTVFPLLEVKFIMNVVAVLFVICAVILILVILIQKGKGGGLSAAFGGGMASGILGSKVGDFLTWLTIGLAGVFLLLAILMAKFYRPSLRETETAAVQTQQPAETTEEPIETVVPEEADVNLPGG